MASARVPRHTFLELLRQLAGEGHTPGVAARCGKIGDGALHPMGRLVERGNTLVGRASARRVVRSRPDRGRKPSNTNRLVCGPLITSAIAGSPGRARR